MARNERIVFLPGLLCDEAVFEAQAQALSRHADVAVAEFDAAGTIEEMARIALAAFEGPLVLIGFSMGGRAAMEAVRLAPHRVARLCLMGTGSHPASETERRDRLTAIDLARREGLSAIARGWIDSTLHPDRRSDRALVASLTAMIMRADGARHERHARALMDRPDARPLLPLIRCPTLVVCGRQDPWVPVDAHREIAAAMPDARLVVVEACGHFVPMERPEASTSALLDWIAAI